MRDYLIKIADHFGGGVAFGFGLYAAFWGLDALGAIPLGG